MPEYTTSKIPSAAGAAGAVVDLGVPRGDPLAPPTRRVWHPGGRFMRKEPSALVPDGDGGYAVDRTTFRTRIDRDGRISFEDKPPVSIGVQVPTMPKVGKHLQRWYDDPYQTLPPPAISLGVGGSFDLTDMLMRAYGDDPYRYEKMLVARDTAALRDDMAARERGRRQREALRNLRAQLDAVWRADAPAATRRARLFALWDDLAERGDADLLRGATAARATIISFIRARLPRGSADGFDDAELRRLDARRHSRAHFTPYP